MNAKDKLELWLEAAGHTPSDILADERVKWELEQDSVDAVGLMRALPWGIRPQGARKQLEFIMLFGG